MSDTDRLIKDESALVGENLNKDSHSGEIEGGSGDADINKIGRAEEFDGIADGKADNKGHNFSDSLVAVSDELRPGAVEALLFASGEPVPLQVLGRLIGANRAQTEDALKRLSDNLSAIGRGVELVEVAGRFQLRTKQSFGPQIRELRAEKPKRLSPAALETLAIVAYRQPVVKSDIERIRGVDTTPTLKTLLERGLIQIVGHQATVGAPALYGTTEEFLKVFGLKDLAALPTLREVGMIEEEPGDNGEEDGESVEGKGESECSGKETESKPGGQTPQGDSGEVSRGV